MYKNNNLGTLNADIIRYKKLKKQYRSITNIRKKNINSVYYNAYTAVKVVASRVPITGSATHTTICRESMQ